MGKTGEKSQLDRFKEAARELGTDDDEERFNEKLKTLAKRPSEMTPEELGEMNLETMKRNAADARGMFRSKPKNDEASND